MKSDPLWQRALINRQSVLGDDEVIEIELARESRRPPIVGSALAKCLECHRNYLPTTQLEAGFCSLQCVHQAEHPWRQTA